MAVSTTYGSVVEDGVLYEVNTGCGIDANTQIDDEGSHITRCRGGEPARQQVHLGDHSPSERGIFF